MSAADAGIPTATYRLQLHRGFGLRDATDLVPYLASLGISHVYCSSYLRARAGSQHGYDITDHHLLNPEVGDEADLDAFVGALRAHGMAQILDFVPNHMGIGQADNAGWLDVLEHGEASPWSAWFDIDWQPAKAELRGKVLAPFLGDHYGRVLERGELRLAFDPESGAFSVWYHEHRFPVAAYTLAALLSERQLLLARELGSGHPALRGLRDLLADLAAGPAPGRSGDAAGSAGRERAEGAKRALARLARDEPAVRRWLDGVAEACNGSPGEPSSFVRLHELLEAQHYRLAFWRVAADEINYRRFFNINELASLRMEREDVFEHAHARVLEWIGAGKLAGLRIDHIDGLFDPRAYCERLRSSAGPGLYLVVEKILAHHESLRADWPVQGTTGYEFLNAVAGIFVDPAGDALLSRIWRRFARTAPSFDDEMHGCKQLVMGVLLGGELQVLAHELDRLSETEWSTRDFTRATLRQALQEIVACFPVYRSYVDARGADDEDRRDIDWAIAQARRRASDPEPTLFDWIHAVLTADVPEALRPRALRFAMRLQQYTAPVTAKAVEDTAFYRQHRLASLNEVGGDPRRFGTSAAAFHKANGERARRWPHTMLATSTHDTKRGEDTRLRIHALSGIAGEWDLRVKRWVRWNRRWKRPVDGRAAPSGAEESLLYQTLVGTWPRSDGHPPEPGAEWLATYHERLRGYALKAVREAKLHSSWRHPNQAYEAQLLAFLAALLDASRPNPFLADLAAFAARVAPIAALHGLAQTVLKATLPGVPDFYQGTEFWDLSLADPDNRRPVDFAGRKAALAAIDALPGSEVAPLLDGWADGRIKLWLTSRLLRLRRRLPALLRDGDYLPLSVEGAQAERVFAFARRAGDRVLIVGVPRLVAPLLPAEGGLCIPSARWQETAIRLAPPGMPRQWSDVLTGRSLDLPAGGGEPSLPVARLFAVLPFAVLLGEKAAVGDGGPGRDGPPI